MQQLSLCVIGEALIDFIPQEKNCKLKDEMTFKKAAGGAPANVAGVVAKLDGKAKLLTKLGNDPFGDYLIECMKQQKIDVSYIKQTNEKDTSLAFVSLDETGNRDFKFYRKSAADLDFGVEDIDENCLDDVGVVHFCSVDLVPSKMKEAHTHLINLAKEKNILISFDPNLRFSLWDDLILLKTTVLEFMKECHILKLSDEELEFICDETDIEKALPKLLKDNCQLVIYTKGKDGVDLFTRDFKISVASYKVDVVDTTGAGDTFIGAFLYQLLKNNNLDLKAINQNEYYKYLDFASLYAGYITTQKGALASLASMETINEFKKTVIK